MGNNVEACLQHISITFAQESNDVD